MGTCCAKPSKAERDDTRIQIPSVVSRQASSNGENTPATCKAYPSVASPASGPSPQIKLDGKAPKGTAAAAKSKGRSSSMRPRPYVPLPERYPMAAKNPSTKSMAVLTHFSAFDNYADSVRVSADRFLTALIKEDRAAQQAPQSGKPAASRLTSSSALHEEATRCAQLNQVLQSGGPLDPESGELQDDITIRAWISGLRSYTAMCSVLCDKYAERLPRMHASVAAPMSAYLSAVSRHGFLARELQQGLTRCLL
mmetsp:Transcript_35896/g.78910  ORF Transcript_35896/g.78910 Transcript_35896/m.78910 type:complete len:253 (-) Transcript_35896:391-1149(-)